MRFKRFQSLSVHARSASVSSDFLPCQLQRFGRVHFIYQTEPLASFDAVNQRRHHAFRPHQSFRLRPFHRRGFYGLFSAFAHCCRLLCFVRVFHASSFLPTFPRRSFATCDFRGLRHCGTMRVLTPAPFACTAQVSPLTPICFPDIPPPTTSCRPNIALYVTLAHSVLSLGFTIREDGSPQHSAETGSLSYGLSFRLQLLSTPPRGDAVIFGFTGRDLLWSDFHQLTNRHHGRTLVPQAAHLPACKKERNNWPDINDNRARKLDCIRCTAQKWILMYII
jgi:hypothetical protein